MTSPAPHAPCSTGPDGPIYPADIRRGYQDQAILSNLSLGIMGFIVAGPLMQLFATDVLHFNAVRIGWILSLMPLGQIFRFAMLYFPRRFTRNQVVTVTCITRLLALALLLILPAGRLTFPTFLALILLFNYSQIVADVFWQPILREITSFDDRGAFFGRMRFWYTIVSSATIGLITFFVGKQITQGQYGLAIAIAFVGMANTLYWSFRLPNLHVSPHARESTAGGWLHLYHVAMRSPLLRRPLIVSLLLSLAVVPVFAVYQRQLLNIPSQIIALCAFVGSVGSTLGFLFWGRITDRIGYRPVIMGTLLLMIATTPLFLLVAPFPNGDFAWTALPAQALVTIAALLVNNFLGGILVSGLGIGMTILMHHHVDHHETVEAMNLSILANAFVVSLAASWSGYLLDRIALPIGDIPFLRGALHIDVVKMYLLSGVALCQFLVIVIAAKLPNSRPNQHLRSFFTSLIALAAAPFRSRS